MGKPVGRGSSRVVFQYDDNIVIKLALNGKGIAQNEAEYDKLCDYSLDVFPKVYDDFKLAVSASILMSFASLEREYPFSFSQCMLFLFYVALASLFLHPLL